jgi:hypothetical protein
MTFRRVARGKVRPRGQMNKLECEYAERLKLRERAGEVEWFAYEAVKLRLANNTFYSPDFLVMLANGDMEVHEVKGFWEDDARVKIKVAASIYPFRFIAVSKGKEGWSVENFSTEVA